MSAKMSSSPMEGTKVANYCGKWLDTVENRTCPAGLGERKVGNFCCYTVGSPLCPWETQGTVAQPPRGELQAKICATQPLGPTWD